MTTSDQRVIIYLAAVDVRMVRVPVGLSRRLACPALRLWLRSARFWVGAGQDPRSGIGGDGDGDLGSNAERRIQVHAMMSVSTMMSMFGTRRPIESS